LLLNPFANFDGMQYVMIVRKGYTDFQQSYFPLYPLLLAGLDDLFLKQHVIEGITLSLIFFISGLFMYKKLIKLLIPSIHPVWSLSGLLFFPTSFFYITLYPESLYLFLSAGGLYFIFSKKYILAAILCYLAALTKLQGVFLCIPFVLVTICTRYEYSRSTLLTVVNSISLTVVKKNIDKQWKILLLSLSPIAGLLTYMGYLAFIYSNPLEFYHSQAAFNNSRTVGAIILLPQVVYRYIKIIFNSDFTIQYFVAVVELVLFLFVFAILLYNLYSLLRNKKYSIPLISLNLYSLTAFILPTLTGTLSSTPRYALISLSFFITIVAIKNRLVQYSVLGIFTALHVVLFILFARGYFVA